MTDRIIEIGIVKTTESQIIRDGIETLGLPQGCTAWVIPADARPKIGEPLTCVDGVDRIPLAKGDPKATGFMIRMRVKSTYNDYMDSDEDWDVSRMYNSCPACEK